jgi:hypothetical protein
MIPTYTFDGARLRDYSLPSIEWLLSVDSITVHKKHGRIVSARFRSQSQGRPVAPCRGSALSGTRFTHLEIVGNTKVITHNPLPAEHAKSERERRLKLAAERTFEARRKVVSDLPVAPRCGHDFIVKL